MNLPFKIVDAETVEVVPWEVGRRVRRRKYDFLLDAIDTLPSGKCIIIPIPPRLIRGQSRSTLKVTRGPRWDAISPAKHAAMRQFSQMLQATLRKYVKRERDYRVSIRQTTGGEVAIFKVAKDDEQSRKVSGSGMRTSLGIAPTSQQADELRALAQAG